MVSALVGRLDPFPAYLKGRRWDVLAANRTARALFTDWSARAPSDAGPGRIPGPFEVMNVGSP